MIPQNSLGNTPYQRSIKLYHLIKNGEVKFAGNKKLKIYGTLKCSSGRRMKPDNRVFFGTEQEAFEQGYRPCGHCMRETYREWKLVQATLQSARS